MGVGDQTVTHMIRGGNPIDHYSVNFLQGMVNRMLTSHHKYGHSRDAAKVIDCLESSKQRVDRYKESGNTEFLMDAANYLMMEFMYPSVEGAHFNAASQSYGRKLKDGRTTDRHVEDLT